MIKSQDSVKAVSQASSLRDIKKKAKKQEGGIEKKDTK